VNQYKPELTVCAAHLLKHTLDITALLENWIMDALKIQDKPTRQRLASPGTLIGNQMLLLPQLGYLTKRFFEVDNAFLQTRWAFLDRTMKQIKFDVDSNLVSAVNSMVDMGNTTTMISDNDLSVHDSRNASTTATATTSSSSSSTSPSASSSTTATSVSTSGISGNMIVNGLGDGIPQYLEPKSGECQFDLIMGVSIMSVLKQIVFSMTDLPRNLSH
jgi:hypothetical protein